MQTLGILDVLLGCAGAVVAVGCYWLWSRVRRRWPTASVRTKSLIVLAIILVVSLATIGSNWKQQDAASTDVLVIMSASGLLLLYLAFARAMDILWRRFTRPRGR